MPDNPPPAYRWAVNLADEPGLRTVEAAYPVFDDGHMILKDSAHKVVFAASPGTCCTFTREGLADVGSAPSVTFTGYPDGCLCTYSWEFGSWSPAGRMTRTRNWACKADHAEIDRTAVLAAGAHGDLAADNPPPGTGFWPCGCPVEGPKAEARFAPGSCPHGFPPTVRCHQCSPVISPAAQADADAAHIRRGTVVPSEIRGMPYGHTDEGGSF
jgi:hypothetical protein